MASSKKKESSGFKTVKNVKASFKYHIGEKLEAGIKLLGTEVKSIRSGGVQINEAFVRIDRKGNAILYNANIKEYAFGNDNNHSPTRPRPLLLHKKELLKLKHATEAEGYTIVPIALYMKHGLIKVEIALCKGKKLFDKRDTVQKRQAEREAGRAMKSHR